MEAPLPTFTIIHGAPASGKHTIGKKLSSLISMPLFHSHLTTNLGAVLFKPGTSEHTDFVWSMRLLAFESVCKSHGSGFIFTWAFSRPHFSRQLDELLALLGFYDAESHFVFLSCPQNIRERRLSGADRLENRKITDVEKMRKYEEGRSFEPLIGEMTLSINSSSLSPQQSAEKICRHFFSDRSIK